MLLHSYCICSCGFLWSTNVGFCHSPSRASEHWSSWLICFGSSRLNLLIRFPTEQFCLLVVDVSIEWDRFGSCYGDSLRVLLFFLHKTLEDKKIRIEEAFFLTSESWKENQVVFQQTILHVWTGATLALDLLYTRGPLSLSVPHWLVAELSAVWEKPTLWRGRTRGDICLVHSTLQAAAAQMFLRSQIRY